MGFVEPSPRSSDGRQLKNNGHSIYGWVGLLVNLCKVDCSVSIYSDVTICPRFPMSSTSSTYAMRLEHHWSLCWAVRQGVVYFVFQ